MGGASRGRMHPLNFMVKRVHLKGVAFGKMVVEAIAGMTPARFDLLFVIRTADQVDGRGPLGMEVGQGAILRQLGLHPSTVSKMVTRLVELGWVTTSQSARDRRRTVVRLTAGGARAIDRAMALVFPTEARPEPKAHQKHFEWLFRAAGRTRAAVVAAIWVRYEELRTIARSFGDRSELSYAELVLGDGRPEELRCDSGVGDERAEEQGSAGRPYGRERG